MSSAKDTTSPADPTFASSEPQLQEFADDPQTGQSAGPNRKPGMKTNMVAREVALTVSGLHSGKTLGQLELFTEETSSLLVHENGGVIQLSADVGRGQLLLLANVESKREVVAQVKRTYKPMNRCVELEFAEPAPRFWGMEFSAATALLPKSAKDQEAAALLSADPNPADAGEVLLLPTAEQIEHLKREIKALKGETYSPEPRADAYEGTRVSVTPTEHDLLPRPSLDFTVPLPKSKGLFRARGKLTPGAGLRLAALITALIATIGGTAWYKYSSSKAAARKAAAPVPVVGATVTTSLPAATRPAPKVNVTFGKLSLPSDAPASSPTTSRSTATPADQGGSQPSALSEPAESGDATPAPDSTTPGAKANVRPSERSSADAVAASPIAASPGDATVPAKLIKSVRAVASLDDLHDFETGNVVIDAVVDTEGAVHFISVISGPPSLRHAAVKAVKEYKYRPAMRNGQPVAEHVHITIRFRFES